MEVPVMLVVGVIAMLYGSVATTLAVLVRMVRMRFALFSFFFCLVAHLFSFSLD
jgi:hypothetical protein